MILLRLFLSTVVALSWLNGCCLGAVSASPAANSTRNNSPTTRYELKFQNEIDNSTITKRESQQQIFKCQIRLGPVSSSSLANGGNSRRARLRSRQQQADQQQQQQQQPTGPHLSAQTGKWPANVTLSIDWFKDDQQLGLDSGKEPVVVVNVELNKSGGGVRNDKKNKSRIEIKNTLNGNQLKLTSRLRISQLKEIDSGQYKCLARATFNTPNINGDSSDSTSIQSNIDQLSHSKQEIAQNHRLFLIEQTLESNGAILIVTNSSSATSIGAEGGGDQEEERKEKGGLTARNGKLALERKPPPTSGGTKSNSEQFASHHYKIRPNETLHANTANGYIVGRQTTDSDEPVDSNKNNNVQAAPASTNGRPNGDQQQQQQQSNGRNEMSGRDNNEYEGAISSTRKSNGNNLGQPTLVSNQFEDDEDLFKMEPDRVEFISGSNGGQHQGPTNDDELDNDQPQQQRTRPLSEGDRSSSTGTNGALDEDSIGLASDGDHQTLDWMWRPNDLDNYNESSSLTPPDNNQQQHPLIGSVGKNYHPANNFAGQETNYGGGGVSNNNNMDNNGGGSYFGGFNSLDSTRLRLAKFVHKIAPELSCYTGNGEHYRGNVSTSADKRLCLNWLHMRRSSIMMRNNYNNNNLNAAKDTLDNHNHNYCRNPNMDPRGPWCFVLYIEELDGELARRDSAFQSAVVGGQIAGGFRLAPNSTSTKVGYPVGPPKYVQRQCSISPCSEYLWLYIVAPPLGLLVLLSCLVTVLVRSIRKSHYNSVFNSNGKRKHTLPRFNKLLMSRGRFALASKKSCANYLDDDIFEIVDDLDWSEGANTQSQSLSPKSTESLKLNSSSFSNSSDADDSRHHQLGGCKSINPMFSDKALDHNMPISAQTTDYLGLNSSSSSGGIAPGNRSVTQVGPMFATLRCHIRGTFKSGQINNRNHQVANSNKSTSTFIEQQSSLSDLANNNRVGIATNTDWLASSAASDSSSSSPASSAVAVSGGNRQQQATNNTQQQSHLISCSTTTEDIESSSFDCTTISEKHIKGSELPQLNASSVSIAVDQQPIYEGKFCQVQLAYINEPNNKSDTANISSGHIGAQVAVCSLKSSAAIDPSIFRPNTLKLRNLNHLNILKLIGYAQLVDDEIGGKQQQQLKPCSLVYDMAQLVDLSDWLKQQSKDSITSNEPGNDLGIRRNLTCFAKQIALAIDYLHDQDIVYKDLACRNCFLDPTKMLIKLASFNHELVIENNNDSSSISSDNHSYHNQAAQNLKSMIRPKYLLDYYVIDSRPSDCQLLPLSWIPLESILFNKFNKQTDVWSFGCLIYELFSLGEVAYFGYSSKQVVDAVRSNLMPPQPLLCPNGIYKLMCKCLSDIPTIRPNVKQIYEQLNLYSGQCSSFLDHHLCSLATTMYDDQLIGGDCGGQQLIELKNTTHQQSSYSSRGSSITKTKSYANIRNFSPLSSASRTQNLTSSTYDNLVVPSMATDLISACKRQPPEVGPNKIPLSKSINLGGNRLAYFNVGGGGQGLIQQTFDGNHYDEPIVEIRNPPKG